MQSNTKIHLGAAGAAGAVLALSALGLAPASAEDPVATATISGTVGENVSTTDEYDGRHLRYVGDPAPAGYGVFYQWGSPYVLTTSPEDGPVTMSGTLDLTDMTEPGQVAVIGLHDADALRAGDRGEKAEVGIYVARKAATYVVGVTDGDSGGGEFVQSAREIDASASSVVSVELVVDGTADPADCASDAADVATADGCMTLTLDGEVVAGDSYGTIVPTDVPVETELGGGAHPGWYSAYPAGAGPDVGVDFDLTISPVVERRPESKDDCKDGGYAAYGFENQGQCVASVQRNAKAGRS